MTSIKNTEKTMVKLANKVHKDKKKKSRKRSHYKSKISDSESKK